MQQAELFNQPPTPRQQGNQERDRAMAAVAAKAEKARAQFQLDARAFVLRALTAHQPQSGESLVNACKAAGIVPHDDRAFGPVFYALALAREIVKVGAVARTKGHMTAGGNLWALHVSD